MLIIRRNQTNPYFNIAAEEYVLKAFTDDVFMLWRNDPCIVVGKHQNTLAEINPGFVKENKIPVIRRISGGGTVFHDLGNINFTFVKNGEDEKLVNFRQFTQPILDVLRNSGVDAQFERRNDLTVGGKKFSGNAEHIYKKRVLHHGTILFESNLNHLSEALKTDALRFADKAVKSVRSSVTNIGSLLRVPMSAVEFMKNIEHYMINRFEDVAIYHFTPEDEQNIEQLVIDKYKTWKWNFGYSPDYVFKKQVRLKCGFFEVNLLVKNGIITEAGFSGDCFNKGEIDELNKIFTGTRHEVDAITSKLQLMGGNPSFRNTFPEDFVMNFF